MSVSEAISRSMYRKHLWLGHYGHFVLMVCVSFEARLVSPRMLIISCSLFWRILVAISSIVATSTRFVQQPFDCGLWYESVALLCNFFPQPARLAALAEFSHPPYAFETSYGVIHQSGADVSLSATLFKAVAIAGNNFRSALAALCWRAQLERCLLEPMAP